MRLRVAVAITLTVIAYFAIALTWRQVFPFRDGIAEFLPEETIAYVHVNLTPAIRSAIQAQLDSLPLATGAPEKHGRVFLEQALDAIDVREFAFVWHRPEKLAPQLALIVGQRASERPDVVSAATFSISGQEIRTFVVRVRTGGGNPPLPLSHSAEASRDESLPLPSRGGEGEKVKKMSQPVQAVLHPREFPIPALEAARQLLPEAITVSGTIGRRGFVLRSDGRIPIIARTTRTELLSEPRQGTIQVIGLPARSIAEQFELPFHGELRTAIDPLLPEAADLLMERSKIAVRMRAPVPPPSEVVLRSLAARLWPIARTRRLDGLSASVLVADPDAFEIAQTDADRWVLRSKGGDARIFAELSGDSVYLATDETLLSSVLPTPSRSPSVRWVEGGVAEIRIPSACHFNGQSALIIWPIHPQAVVTMSVDQSGSSAALCGRIAQPEN